MRTILDDAVAVDVRTPGSLADRFERILLTGQIVHAMRQSLGASVAELANASGVSGSSIEATERATATPPTERHALSVGLAWLLNNPIGESR